MCWSHVHRNISPKLLEVRKFNKILGDNILNASIQWMVLQEEEECLCGEGLPVHLLRRAEGGEEAADLPCPGQGDEEADPQVAGDRHGAPGSEDQAGHGLVWWVSCRIL